MGKRLPTLEHWRDDAATAWTALTVPRWYSETSRVVEVVSQTALWYHTGLPPLPIRWVLIRDPLGKFATQALLCTNLDATPLQQTAWYSKATPTFSDALALVRRQLWTQATFPTSPGDADVEKVPRPLLNHLANLLCYAA